jgi:hypothetical protein
MQASNASREGTGGRVSAPPQDGFSVPRDDRALAEGQLADRGLADRRRRRRRFLTRQISRNSATNHRERSSSCKKNFQHGTPLSLWTPLSSTLTRQLPGSRSFGQRGLFCNENYGESGLPWLLFEDPLHKHHGRLPYAARIWRVSNKYISILITNWAKEPISPIAKSESRSEQTESLPYSACRTTI